MTVSTTGAGTAPGALARTLDGLAKAFPGEVLLGRREQLSDRSHRP